MMSFVTRKDVKVSWWTRMPCCYENFTEMGWLSTSIVDDTVMGRENIHTRYHSVGRGFEPLSAFNLSRCSF